ncbi:hypothetical protein SAMN02982917_2376 [Azospirillum oryzae]|uniref:Uncharacterized protein n=1 Tax=Azospirillum oryzae TaxID=286727 RepID=A0A1X7F965_9PROT|nr:hypothetical protein [Azospirillum oryzae]SMF48404.1 hypothetical protein SAMN02982917_2376 [Azospirillum oryzae]
MPDWFLQALGYATLYALVVKAVLACTPTPPADRWYGKVYRVLEWSVLVIGRVKEGAGR